LPRHGRGLNKKIMREITLEEIQKKFESLPEDLKWAVMAANVDENIIDIGQAQGLNVEQMGQLSLETHLVMFGFTHPDKFEEAVKNSLKLPDEKIRAIVSSVNEKILKEIRAKMMEAFGGAPKTEKPAEEEKEARILNSAGIEIIPKKEEAHPILTQKLSDFTKNEVVKTEHVLENLSSSQANAVTANNAPRIDPYREKPE